MTGLLLVAWWSLLALSLGLSVAAWRVQVRRARRPHFDPARHLLAVWVDHGGAIHVIANVEIPPSVVGDVLIEAAAIYQTNRPEFKEVSPWLD